ncbi:hypothetical protein [Nitrosococcus watsonii]|uniref:Uncharacterized protein n=1 Tax=Nitrosococcus watsoni (strain C-113) TaxID=105559 RepID=D8K5K9_NITWC|nr:hypothetical protein [Nitrosococcus watsonii]ADJ28186.1 hypothetical protein Nwat_1257 [Nitrosococcus watsonii C-113]
MLFDERRLRSAVRTALGHLGGALDAIAPSSSAERGGPAETALLEFIQQLIGSVDSKNPKELHETFLIEPARFRRQLESLEIDVVTEWSPEAPADDWRIRRSPTVPSPKTVLSVVRRGDRIAPGVVYLTLSKETCR